MGVLKLENLPKEALPLTRSADIKLVLDTPKGMFCVFFLFILLFRGLYHLSCQSVNASKERARKFVEKSGYQRRCIRVWMLYFLYMTDLTFWLFFSVWC